MGEAEFIGTLITSLSIIFGLFMVVYKPLQNNTKAMTTLTLRLDYLIDRMDKHEENYKEHLEDFENYKEKVRESQKRQWDEIDRQKEEIIGLKNKNK